MLANHAGNDKWDALIAAAETYTLSMKWDGAGATTLESRVERLRTAYTDMESAA